MRINDKLLKMEKQVKFYQNRRQYFQNGVDYWSKLERHKICELLSYQYGLIWGYTIVKVKGEEYLIAPEHIQIISNVMEKGLALMPRDLYDDGFKKNYIRLNLEVFLTGEKVGSYSRGRTTYFDKVLFLS